MHSKEFQTLVHSTKKLITKREHKLVDYDRHRDSHKKLTSKSDRDVRDEKRLGQIETVFSARASLLP